MKVTLKPLGVEIENTRDGYHEYRISRGERVETHGRTNMGAAKTAEKAAWAAAMGIYQELEPMFQEVLVKTNQVVVEVVINESV